MKKVWYESTDEIGFDSLETAIKSIKSYFGKNYNIETKKISDSQYVVIGTRKNDTRYVERYYIFEIPICETVVEYAQEMLDDDGFGDYCGDNSPEIWEALS